MAEQHTEPEPAIPIRQSDDNAANLERAEPGAEHASLARGPTRVGTSFLRQLMTDIDDLFLGLPFGISPRRKYEAREPGMWSPLLEALTRGERLVFRADLPGVGREQVKVEIAGNVLIISGRRIQDASESAGGQMYTERSYGLFERRIPLPEGCDTETVEAIFDNGVLEVSLVSPKPKSETCRTIEIKHPPAPDSESTAEPLH